MDLIQRPRRLRGSENLRKMVRETRMDKSSLVYPMFVMDGENKKEEIPTMPGQFRYTLDRMPEILQEMVEQTGAKSTDLQSPETVEHLCGKCADYACQWKETADKLWEEHPYVHKGYSNYKKK